MAGSHLYISYTYTSIICTYRVHVPAEVDGGLPLIYIIYTYTYIICTYRVHEPAEVDGGLPHAAGHETIEGDGVGRDAKRQLRAVAAAHHHVRPVEALDLRVLCVCVCVCVCVCLCVCIYRYRYISIDMYVHNI